MSLYASTVATIKDPIGKESGAEVKTLMAIAGHKVLEVTVASAPLHADVSSVNVPPLVSNRTLYLVTVLP